MRIEARDAYLGRGAWAQRWDDVQRWRPSLGFDCAVIDFVYGDISARDLWDVTLFWDEQRSQLRMGSQISPDQWQPPRWISIPRIVEAVDKRIAAEKHWARRDSRRDDVPIARACWVRWRRMSEENNERGTQWAFARQQRMEKQRQRRSLRQGRQTLTAIRRYLHGAGALPLQESQLARTSPTS